MQIYIVKQKYYLDGNIEVDVERKQLDEMPENIFIETEKYNYYEDYYSNEKDATSRYYKAVKGDPKRVKKSK